VRAVVVVVGKRTEHWEAFFRALTRRPDLEVVVQAADVSPLARERLGMLAEGNSRLHFQVAPHLLGEELTGHMASVLFGPGSWRWLAARRSDVIHVIGEAAYLSTAQAIRFRNRFWPGVPITLYAAQNVVTRFPWPFSGLERFAHRQAALALPITAAALSVLRAKGFEGPAEIVPLGVDLDRFRPRRAAPADPFTVGFVGRLEPHKGVADLLTAADLLDARLLVVGDGSLRPRVEAEVARRRGHVELVGWASHDELPQLLARMHALALPSVEVLQRNVLPWVGIPLREQFGRVALEAMASGVPVVGSRVGEIPHVVGSGGLICPPGDPVELARALARLRDSPSLAAALARAGIARSREFGWDRVTAQVYDQWLKLRHEDRSEALRLAA
jgi:glycosyltransferase involved in cell wall biosynthesis